MHMTVRVQVVPRALVAGRRVDGVESFLDPVAMFFERPGQVQQIAHPGEGGDDCTQIVLSGAVIDSIVSVLSSSAVTAPSSTMRIRCVRRFDTRR